MFTMKTTSFIDSIKKLLNIMLATPCIKSGTSTKDREANRNVPSVRRLFCAIAGLSLMVGHPSSASAAEAARNLLQEHHIQGPEAEQIITCFTRCEELGLPTDFLRLRLREGVTKQVGIDQIQTALAQRMQALKRASRLVACPDEPSGRRRRRRHGHDDSIETLARALESGLPLDALETLFTSTRGNAKTTRLLPIVEAGEMLHLAGVKPESIQHFMHDCRERRLGRREILRAARYWIDKHERGIEPETIRRQLWGETPPRDTDSRHDPKRPRQRGRPSTAPDTGQNPKRLR